MSELIVNLAKRDKIGVLVIVCSFQPLASVSLFGPGSQLREGADLKKLACDHLTTQFLLSC